MKVIKRRVHSDQLTAYNTWAYWADGMDTGGCYDLCVWLTRRTKHIDQYYDILSQEYVFIETLTLHAIYSAMGLE